MINFENFYEQSLTVTHKIFNLLIFIFFTIIIIHPKNPFTLLNFIMKQIYPEQFINSGNITVIFIIIVITSFLFEHLGLWANDYLFGRIYFDSTKFNVLITTRYFNILTLVNNEGVLGQSKLDNAIRNSVVTVFTIGDAKSQHQRDLGALQNKYRYYQEYSGTFKLISLLAAIKIILDFVMFIFGGSLFYDLILLVVLLVSIYGWYHANLMRGKTTWEMLNRYWLHTKNSNINDFSKEFNEKYDKLVNKYGKMVWESTRKASGYDVKNAMKFKLS